MKIFIPTPLRVYTDKQDAVEVSGKTIEEALSALTSKYPDFQKHLYTGDGKLRSFVNVYLNDEDVRYLPEREQTAIEDHDTLSIIPSIAGGAGQTGNRAFGGADRTGNRAFGACCCCTSCCR